jgi:hypothetical protein
LALDLQVFTWEAYFLTISGIAHPVNSNCKWT